MNNISYIATEKLLPNPNQPRHQFQSEEMLSLANSIKKTEYSSRFLFAE